MDQYPFDTHVCKGELIPTPNINFFVKLIGKKFENSGGTKDLMKYVIMNSSFAANSSQVLYFFNSINYEYFYSNILRN